MTKQNTIDTLALELEEKLFEENGPMMFGDLLRKALGYRSGDAFRQAARRGTLPIYTFKIENRRGRFAMTKDVAKWLASQRYSDEGNI
ncbi:hypothetical protein [Alteromonas sp. W364]|uniref:hypothetical protein n=1 Tax=Alteromonas sp. W364 TaxID=3075610 RepID=UPI002884BD87|nr:hypothetical protein [Alteromonas sp. W364]MDT0627462.1 hypothetical protein [Alteromonas sp. W364]